MTQFSHPENDPKLEGFLKKNCPIVPESISNLEVKLFDSLTPRKKANFSRWLIPGAIAAGFAAIWMGHQTFDPSSRYQSQSQILDTFLVDSWHESQSQILDTFLVDSWHESIEIEMTLTEW